jgi:16S rRNA A1518/A1519 N6-dimethyltransferase RsmA/KsgA/DIM1 with predicted DNA glycosylase/AP lyase activity
MALFVLDSVYDAIGDKYSKVTVNTDEISAVEEKKSIRVGPGYGNASVVVMKNGTRYVVVDHDLTLSQRIAKCSEAPRMDPARLHTKG